MIYVMRSNTNFLQMYYLPQYWHLFSEIEDHILNENINISFVILEFIQNF
jgi:hypothetical protein